MPLTLPTFPVRLSSALRFLLAFALFAVLLTLPQSTAGAFSALPDVLAAPTGTIIVNTLSDNNTVDGSCTLREAITRANAGSASADCPGATGAPNTITFSVNGTITLASTLPSITNALTMTGNGTANTVIEASATPNTVDWRVFAFISPFALQISDLTLRNGGNNNTFSTSGGCLNILNGGPR